MSKLFEIHSIQAETDLLNLKEIFKLRVECWSETGFLNQNDFPDGWSDDLDSHATHFYAIANNRIIASSRVNIINSIYQIPISRVYENYGYEKENDIGYISRNVVHPSFRARGLSKLMDIIRLNFLRKNAVRYCFADANQRRMETLTSYGFEVLGRIPQDAEENYRKDPDTYVLVKKF